MKIKSMLALFSLTLLTFMPLLTIAPKESKQSTENKISLHIDDPAYLMQTEKFIKKFYLIPGEITHTSLNIDAFPNFNQTFEDCAYQWAKHRQYLANIPIFKELIEKNNLHVIRPQTTYIIPPIIHQIWVGPKSRERFEKLRQTWLQHHPGWLYMLWTDKEVKELRLVNRELYDKSTNYVQRADLLRYELLYIFGGVYADMDAECVKPFDLLNRCYEFFTGLWDARPIIINGLMGSIPRHPILRNVILRGKNNNHLTIAEQTGPHFLTESFIKVVPQCQGPIMLFPPNYFTPPVKTPMHKNQDDFIHKGDILPETFSIHGFAASANTSNIPITNCPKN